MGAGGVILPPAGYFEKVQAVLKAYDVLLIADEVITGFGRTGAMFGCETYGIRPDLITLAKALSSGYQPIGAVLISEPIARDAAGAEPQDRHLRPWLHLRRPSGLRGGGAAHPRDLRGGRHPGPGAGAGAAVRARASRRSPAIRWSATRARSAWSARSS